jgi:hypothetical protein
MQLKTEGIPAFSGHQRPFLPAFSSKREVKRPPAPCLYSVKSMHLDLLNDNAGYLHKYLWKMKVLLKIKILMGFVHRKEILIKDNLVKRNWQGSSKCCFCDQEGTV